MAVVGEIEMSGMGTAERKRGEEAARKNQIGNLDWELRGRQPQHQAWMLPG